MNKNSTPAGTKILKALRLVSIYTNPGHLNMIACALVLILINNIKNLLWVITAGNEKKRTDISVRGYSATNPVITACSDISLSALSPVVFVNTIAVKLQGCITQTATGFQAGTSIQSINSQALVYNGNSL